ncbi:hypothetical protein [Actinokineospora sp. NBRC 105648]|uniref:hypothetical protein n=1 Tax=Actinokineospora sp. NBRC 105648 TaxID=3032206 RepID=UPI0024A3632A|nr:hypothetical protein [Actinokineospora sp. NBRC 105648]GLZ43711.1 hypothetical protein Acsp05_73350 [Actinokineospora sp. NBRC 105648]
MIESEVIAAVTLAVDVSRELDDDHVEFWRLATNLRRSLPSADGELIRGLARAVLVALLDRGVVLGDLDGDTGEFTAWPATVASIDIAMAAWRSLGRDPDMGEIAWLSRPSSLDDGD